MSIEKKLDPISVRLDPETKQGLAALAKADDRPLATYAARVLRQHVEANAKGKKPKG